MFTIIKRKEDLINNITSISITQKEKHITSKNYLINQSTLNNILEMDYQYILGGEILACSLAFVFVLYIAVEKKKARKIDSSSSYLKTNGPKNRICSSLMQEAAGGTVRFFFPN